MKTTKKDKTKTGIKYEKLIRDIFKNAGYLVEFKYRNQWDFNKDFFHMWDIMAIKDGLITYVQAKYKADGELDHVITFKGKAIEFMEIHGSLNKYMIILIDSRREFRAWVWNRELKEWKEETGLNI